VPSGTTRRNPKRSNDPEYDTTVSTPNISSPPSRSTFVTGLSLVSVVIALFLTVTDLTGLISYINLTDSAEYRTAMRLLQAYQPDASSLSLNAGWMMTSSITGIAVNLATIIASYGLFRRLKWGRISFISVVVVQTIFYFVTIFSTYFMARSFLSGTGIDQVAGGTSIMAMGEAAGIIGGVLVIAFAVVIVRKLSSAEVRREFEAGSASLSSVKTS